MSESASIDVPITDAPEPAESLPDIPADKLPASTITSLDRIKAKLAADRTKDAQSLSFKLPVPQRPYLLVEYGPIIQQQWNGLQAKALEVGMSDVDMQARGLSMFVRGVYLKLDDGEVISADLNSPELAAPKFDERLAKSLGIAWGGVVYELVKAIYVLDGELASTALALLQLSGFGKLNEVVASAEGN